jgi:hypothetical protein
MFEQFSRPGLRPNIGRKIVVNMSTVFTKTVCGVSLFEQLSIRSTIGIPWLTNWVRCQHANGSLSG